MVMSWSITKPDHDLGCIRPPVDTRICDLCQGIKLCLWAITPAIRGPVTYGSRYGTCITGDAELILEAVGFVGVIVRIEVSIITNTELSIWLLSGNLSHYTIGVICHFLNSRIHTVGCIT